MKTRFYPRLAVTGIRSNKRLYIPYILTCSGMTAMFYIIASLVYCPLIKEIRGGANILQALSLGRGVIAAFSLLFLFYTNSFLIRRRKKEFGLYNILGMNKKNIARIMFWEVLIISAVSLAAGLAAGILVSKFAELALLNIVRADVDYTLSVSTDAIIQTTAVFMAIFILILINALLRVRLSAPLSLLKSENAGEKPPKANWVLAFAGVLTLGYAYYMAVSIKSPISAINKFFIAVLLVIAATYILFITGSVAFCRILQRNKRYYYKPNHFVSVASMVYRMKRNGAGLASICILSTMVLVMLSSTTSLYIGTEDSINSRYPRNIGMELRFGSMDRTSEENLDSLRSIAEKAASDNGVKRENILEYRCAHIFGMPEGSRIVPAEFFTGFVADMDYDSLCSAVIVPLADYNRITNSDEALEKGEALVYCTTERYKYNTLTVGNARELVIKKDLDSFPEEEMASDNIISTIFVIVPDFDEYIAPLTELTYKNGGKMLSFYWYHGFDADAPDERHIEVRKQILETLRELKNRDDSAFETYSCYSVVLERMDFYSSFGGLFFLGIMLSIVFIFAAVLIIYYKQISEGYEDQSRFEIMQKVGMTRKDIRKSVNSQVLMVFFMPLAFAGLHLAFAFPLIWKVLKLFNLRNLTLFIVVTICCYLLFGLFYALVYRVTSSTYYKIVSGINGQNV